MTLRISESDMPKDSVEAMLPKSLGGSESEIQGVRHVMMNSSEMNTGLRPAPLLGIHHDMSDSLDF